MFSAGECNRALTPLCGDMPEQALLSLVRPVQRSLIGIGGSVAGLSAVMYGCGYLVTRGHLQALGLSGVVEEPPNSMLQEGGKFLFVTGYLILRTAFVFVVIAGMGTLVLLVFWALARRFFVPVTGLSVWRRPVFLRWGRALLYVFALGTLVVHLNYFLGAAQAPAQVSDLLFTDPRSVPAQGTASEPLFSASGIKSALLQGKRPLPETVYGDVVFGTIAAIVLAVLGSSIAATWRLRIVAATPFIAGAVVFLLILPFDYGVLEKTMQYPQVVAQVLPGKSDPATVAGFMLEKSATNVLIWSPATRRLHALRPDQLSSLDILGNAPLFPVAPSPDKATAKE